MKKYLYAALCSISIGLLVGGCDLPASAPPTGVPAREPRDTVVSLTFDDGNADNFNIGPLLRANGLHATFYIPSGLVGDAGYMTWDQLQVLQGDGNEIGGHTLDHRKIEGLAPDALRHQVCDDRATLTAHGFRAVSFAYPFGNYDQDARQMVADCGYADARTIHGGPEVIPPSDPYALLGFPYVVDDTDLAKLKRYVSGTTNEGGGWVILIFHHVCESCDYFSVKPEIMNDFVPWLARQQSKGHLRVMTVEEVILGPASP
jgi:peptidoglycan/xylan/chitin deacetylase (PgdA/CDA1 family)